MPDPAKKLHNLSRTQAAAPRVPALSTRNGCPPFPFRLLLSLVEFPQRATQAIDTPPCMVSAVVTLWPVRVHACSPFKYLYAPHPRSPVPSDAHMSLELLDFPTGTPGPAVPLELASVAGGRSRQTNIAILIVDHRHYHEGSMPPRPSSLVRRHQGQPLRF